jgi:hypothetical protein
MASSKLQPFADRHKHYLSIIRFWHSPDLFLAA